HRDVGPVVPDVQLEAPVVGGDQAGVERFHDARMGDALPIVVPGQVLVEDQPAVLAGVPAPGDADLRHARSMAARENEVNPGPAGGHVRRTSSVKPRKASAPQVFTSTDAASSTRTPAARNDQPESPRSKTR